MADNAVKSVLSLVATTSSRVKDLVIKDGQLIFIHDRGRIAFDYKGKRTFYNQVEELETDLQRQTLQDPISGRYYFVIDTAVFWRYQDGEWFPLTKRPEEIVFIGAELPELGVQKTLYVDTENRTISVWKEDNTGYQIVSEKTRAISDEKIVALFA